MTDAIEVGFVIVRPNTGTRIVNEVFATVEDCKKKIREITQEKPEEFSGLFYPAVIPFVKEKSMTDAIEVGARVRSYDFETRDLEGERACYMEGTVEGFTD